MSASRHPVEWMNEHVVVFRDDDRDGWKMTITRSEDGDFWIGMVPDFRDLNEDERAAFDGRCGGIRVRMPMIGGGSHELLYAQLASFWAKLTKARSRQGEAR